MHNKASLLCSKITFAHMTNRDFDLSYLLEHNEYKISLFDGNKKEIFGNIKHKIDFDKVFSWKNKQHILVDNSSVGHLGIFI